MADEYDITKCCLCSKSFTDAKNIPRLLPCSETMCQACIETYISNSPEKLTCPKCEATYTINGSKMEPFPINIYVLHIVKLLKECGLEGINPEENYNPLPKCPVHNRELGLYCNDPQCQKTICQKCSHESHKKHEIIDIDEKDQQELIKAVDNVGNKIQVQMAHLKAHTQSIQEENAKTRRILENKKAKHIEKVSEMVKHHKKAMKSRSDINLDNIKDKINFLDSNLEKLHDMKHAAVTYSNHANMMEITQSIKDNVAGVSQECIDLKVPKYKCPDKGTQNLLLQGLCGQIEETQVEVFSTNTKISDIVEKKNLVQGNSAKIPQQDVASESLRLENITNNDPIPGNDAKDKLPLAVAKNNIERKVITKDILTQERTVENMCEKTNKMKDSKEERARKGNLTQGSFNVVETSKDTMKNHGKKEGAISNEVQEGGSITKKAKENSQEQKGSMSDHVKEEDYIYTHTQQGNFIGIEKELENSLSNEVQKGNLMRTHEQDSNPMSNLEQMNHVMTDEEEKSIEMDSQDQKKIKQVYGNQEECSTDNEHEEEGPNNDNNKPDDGMNNNQEQAKGTIKNVVKDLQSGEIDTTVQEQNKITMDNIRGNKISPNKKELEHEEIIKDSHEKHKITKGTQEKYKPGDNNFPVPQLHDKPVDDQSKSFIGVQKTCTFKLQLNTVTSLVIASEDSIIVTGEDKFCYTKSCIQKYTFQGKLVTSEQLPNEPAYGASVVVNHQNHPSILLAYSERKSCKPGIKFDFHSMDHLKAVSTYHTTGNRGKIAGMMCAVTQNIVLYEDLFRTPSCIRWLDCTNKQAGPAPGKEAIQTRNENIYDMCCIQNESKLLLVTVDPEPSGKKAINAYNLDSGKLQWTLSGKLGKMKSKMCPRSICTDNFEKLYVLDENNNCIVVISLDGKYIDSILNGDEVISDADWIRWTNGNQLVVHHSDIQDIQYISLFQFVKDIKTTLSK